MSVIADALVPVFPSVMFPALYSIATSLYPENHGLVGNQFFDRERDQEYYYRNRAIVEDGTCHGGEPIWVTVETQRMVTAAFFFVGIKLLLRGVRPTFWKKYDRCLSNRKRIDETLT